MSWITAVSQSVSQSSTDNNNQSRDTTTMLIIYTVRILSVHLSVTLLPVSFSSVRRHPTAAAVSVMTSVTTFLLLGRCVSVRDPGIVGPAPDPKAGLGLGSGLT